MKKATCLFIWLLAIAIISKAQAPCTQELHILDAIKNNPAYGHSLQEQAEKWLQYQQQKKNNRIIVTAPSDTVYELPVVVHIVHSGEPIGDAFNPPDIAIDSFIDYLNHCFAATWPLYPDTAHGGVRIRIQFTLAKRDTACNPTNGIIRINGSVLPNYATYGIDYSHTTPAASDAAVKSLSIWPRTDYYNIWVVKYIDGPAGAYVGAYAYYPGPARYDGAVFAAKYVRKLSTGLYWYLAPHELGHAFSLMHTFEGDMGGTACPINTMCTVNGDQICDTEPHINSGAGTCASGVNPCTGASYAGVQYNFMNYTACADRFTKDQRDKVMFSLLTYRPNLISSLGGTAPSSVIYPALSCIPTITNPGNTFDLGPWSVSLADLHVVSYGYSTEASHHYLDKTCIQDAAHLLTGKSYTIEVLTSDTEKVRAWIDYNDDAIFQPTELVLNHNGTKNYETHSATIAIPSTGVVTGKRIRMRVASDDIKMADPTPCGSFGYGQAEDYSVLIDIGTQIPEPYGLDEVQVYPNPTSGIVNVSSPNPLDLSLFSMDGKMLFHSEGINIIDTKGLSEGFYMLRMTDNKNGFSKTVKINKER